MGTAKQLIPTFVDAQPIVWNRDFVQNMRHIRGYPNWWRIRDDQSFIDGPPSEGEQYTRELFIWRAEIVKDASDENTDTLELYNLAEFLTVTEEVVDGETIYSYKYRDTLPALSYTHTDVIDSVSLEFDQLGRRMVAFESMGDVFLLWYDSQAGGTVVTNWGAGYNPFIVTDTYRRTGGSGDSERLLFYVDNTTKQIVYRRQLDRFTIEYTLPDAPQDVVELIKVSKNIYGGLTVLYCYDDGAGGLLTGSFTATAGEDVMHIGTDDTLVSHATLSPLSGSLLSFKLGVALVLYQATEATSLIPFSGSLVGFELRSSNNFLEPMSETLLVSTEGNILNFELKSSTVSLLDQNSTATLAVGTGSILNFTLVVTKIATEPANADTATLVSSSGTLTTFTLG